MEQFFKLYEDLVKLSDEIKPYYDIDKIKPYSVYVWTKEDESNENVFDIESNSIYMYNKEHIIKEEAKPVIRKIQSKLKEIEPYLDN